MNVQVIKWVFIIIAVLYFISPIDILPDRVHPLLGRLDDFLLIGLLMWRFNKLKRALQGEAAGRPEETKGETVNTPPQPEKPFDPYAELEVSRGATLEEIETAYKRLMAQYHPDKVHHLGSELKKVAHEKTLSLQKAYEMLRGA